ncbi:hypothetical protein EBT31_18390, partial [bacterium]|nr:hypothetical protein [bacterium]
EEDPNTLKEEKNQVAATDLTRSAKCMRLIEKLDEIVANDHQALVFTQFREMGELLVPMIQQALQHPIQRLQLIYQFLFEMSSRLSCSWQQYYHQVLLTLYAMYT